MSYPSRLVLLFFVTLLPVLAHPGGLDSKGGHMDRKTGVYHYHRTPPSADSATPAVASTPQREPTKERPQNAPPTPAAVPPSAPVSVSLATSPLAKIAVGMTKAQVEAMLGKPNIASENAWIYADHGWVRFRGDAVFSIEAK